MNRIIPIFVLMIIVFGAGCINTDNGNDNESISDDAVIVHLTYGAFTLPEMAIQELVVNETAVNFSIYNYDYQLTERYIKPLNESMRSEVLETFRSNDFLELNATYVPQEGQPVVADVGVVEITLVEDNFSKTVKVDPYYDAYMPENLKEIDQQLRDLREYAVSTSPEEAEGIAEEWIMNAPTYSYDGSNLTMEKHEILEAYPEQHRLNYSFISRHAGYGNRSGEMVAQVITPHNIVVTVAGGEVTAAVIDGVWDERSQRMLADMVAMETSMPCNETPWEEWYGQGDIQFITEPTEEELVIAYFGEVYDIEVSNFESTRMDAVTCRFTLETGQEYVDRMEELGWKTSTS